MSVSAIQVEDLSVASPATVSRCGMVYMEPEALGFRPLVDSWLKTLPPTFKDSHKSLIESLCDEIFPGGIATLRKQCKEVIATVNSNLYSSCLRLLESVCCRYRAEEKLVETDQRDPLSRRIPAAFIFTFIWSCGITPDGKLTGYTNQCCLLQGSERLEMCVLSAGNLHDEL